VKAEKELNNIVELQKIEKIYGHSQILKSIDLTIKAGEFLTLLGPSGSGKTTILRIIGGFTKPSAGIVKIKGQNVTNFLPHKRPVNTVFQNYALFPHMNVFNNIAFGLKISKKKLSFIKQEVAKIIKLVGLQGHDHKNINQLSGGQKQRVALARALINKPQVLLLDEPLSALDKKLRLIMQKELKKIHKNLKITFVFVTHDQEEALSLSDRIVVVNEGKIIQQGSPKDIYDEPINKFTANFIGHSNIIEQALFIRDKLVKFDNQEIACVDIGFGTNVPVNIVIRPEDIDLVAPEQGFFQGIISNIIYKGLHYEVTVTTKKRIYTIETTDLPLLHSAVGISWKEADIHVMAYEKI